jgi:transposase
VANATWLIAIVEDPDRRLGATTKVGERSPGCLLMIGAQSVIIRRHPLVAARHGTWLGGMLTRESPMLALAQANSERRSATGSKQAANGADHLGVRHSA